MTMENLPQEPEDIMNILQKAKFLKIEGENIKVQYTKNYGLEIKPKNSPIGLGMNVENGEIKPSLIFDTKKEIPSNIDSEDIVSKAIEDFLNDSGKV